MPSLLGEVDRDGYRRLILNKQRVRAHRYIWMLFYGEIPDGMVVMHACDNPPCINPFHLKLGTNKDNVVDMQQKGRKPRGERAYQARLTDAQAEQIIEALRADSSLTRIGKQFGVSKHVINDIKRGKTWKHLPR